MEQQKTLNSADDMIEAINRFLDSPPDGTPAEIIEIFGGMDQGHYLPPKLFLETVQQAPIAISITDPSASILYVNSAFEELTGYDSAEILGMNESALSSKSTPIEVYKQLWAHITSKKVWHGKLVNHRKNKEEYLAELTISPVLKGDGEIAYFLGMHRDISDVHKLEQRLNFQKKLTEVALDAAPMVVAMMNRNLEVVMDNQAYKALQGDFRGSEPADLFIEALEKQFDSQIKTLCLTGQGFTNIEIRLDPPGSSSPRWFSCSGVRLAGIDDDARYYFQPVENESCHFLLIANEITGSRKRINEARMNMIRASMSELQLTQAMREAISGAIYKLQVPLNVIRAAMAIPGDMQDDQSLKNILAHALETGEEAMDSLHTALPGAQQEEFAAVNLNETLHEVLNLCTDQLLALGVVIDWRPTPVLKSIEGRANELRGLFKYLIDNAIKAVHDSQQSSREIRIETKQEDDDIVISVMDNGPGIPDAHRLQVFEPFYCGWEQPRNHAGMGLTMAQEIVINHGGSIDIDPDFLGGCRVFVRLPS